ncbi:MAG TPA: hypothetical protein PL051_04160 [Candidatus Saccharibacteria bacterium]|nr:hypothetical protein [Candidatus Saccharibacteria bacterium]
MPFEDTQPFVPSTSGMDALTDYDQESYAAASAARRMRQAQATAAAEHAELDAVPTQPRGRLLSTTALKKLVPKPKPSTGRHVATRN